MVRAPGVNTKVGGWEYLSGWDIFRVKNFVTFARTSIRVLEASFCKIPKQRIEPGLLNSWPLRNIKLMHCSRIKIDDFITQSGFLYFTVGQGLIYSLYDVYLYVSMKM